MANFLSSLDWSRVQAFLAVVDTGSLSGAARQLGTSQPTLGRQVKALEEALATRLFRREAKGLALTEAGAALVEPARAMQEAAMRMQLTAAGREEELAGTVRITAPVSVSRWMLPAIVARLRREEPEIQVELVPNDASDNLLFREADIAVRMYQPTQLDLVALRLGDLRMGLYAAERYLEGRELPTEFAALMQMDLVGNDREERIIRGMREFGIAADRHSFGARVDDQSVYWALVCAGCGLGFGPCMVGDVEPGVVPVLRGPPVPSLPMWLAAHEEVRRVPRVVRVWDALAEALPPLLDPAAPRA
ncbi:LysR family transcriptional regulator [Vannielia litorea]|uniref:LysR family transcriptional regulator n=1 Tax=Vannielia litorea TaxID=1217970 RepID=UPI001C95E52C|nr:LysR family transcriptional regulator [Vannielia litorea]MBY6049764.1 LysR family transcriptional regulator [Vannielia litorea]MBY6077178.1 LysR family transcriptional regulator [Vannielia litorea]